MTKNTSYERYQRQMLLPEIGEAGQKKLLRAKVLVIGAGGLGCPVLLYLTAAGVGTLGIVDDDVVSISNLHRQVLYNGSDIGLSKAKRAAAILQSQNPDIVINTYNWRLHNQNAFQLISEYDIVVDGTDNFSSRYMINDACVLLNKPLVYAAISRFEGQVAVFNCVDGTNEKAVNYRDLFPVPPVDSEVMSCAVGGVLGVLPGIIGSMQANETIKLITGIGEPLINRLLTYNALNNQLYELALTASADTGSYIPKDEIAFKNFNYDWACASHNALEIDTNVFDTFLAKKNITIIDVRQPDELPEVDEFSHVQIPLATLTNEVDKFTGDVLITFCQSGGRSLQAATLLSDIFGDKKKIYSLKDGIVNWKSQRSKKVLRENL